MSATGQPGYRPDIDGLRALAIVPVVLFHIGVPGFAGGFIGVDIFFVLSGFLITRLLQQELGAGTFSFTRFWLRRARRLLPALALVLAVTVGVGALCLEAEHFRRIGRQCLAVTTFLGNVWALRNAGGYWGPAGDDFHFLHAWSLAVEEQFYLLFPPLLVLLHRRSRNPGRWLLGIALLSLASCLPGPWRNPSGVFFLPHGRAWELLAGALLARHSLQANPSPASRRTHCLLGSLGLVLILAGFWLVRPGHLFPGLLGLLPVLGTVLCIAGGPGTPIGRCLASPVPVYIGRISYAWYLWHWPLLLFLRNSGLEEAWSTFVLSFALASLTHHAVELPCRSLHVRHVPLLLIPVAGAMALSCALPGIVRHPVEKVPPPLRWCDCEFAPNPKPESLACTPSGLVRSPLGAFVPATPIAPGPIHAVLLGDSHGRSLLPALDTAARSLRWNYAAFTSAGARPFPIPPDSSWTNYAGSYWNEASRRALDDSYRNFFAATSPPVVIVVARWNALAQAGRARLLSNIGNLRRLSPGSTFLFIGQPPQLGFGTGGFLSGELALGPFVPLQEPRGSLRNRTRVHEWLRGLESSDAAVRFLDISPVFLDGARIRFRQGQTLNYFDDDHLTIAGAALAEPLLREALVQIARTTQPPIPLPIPSP